MLSKKEIFDLLFEKKNLWKSETRHEAMLLCKSLYSNAPELREEIMRRILLGPSPEKADAAESPEDSERDEELENHKIFTQLKYLEDSGFELTEIGKKRLEEIKNKYPDWRLREDPDIASPSYAGWHRNKFSIEEIYAMAPREVAEMLRDYRGTWERERRDLSEAVGETCRQYPERGLEIFGYLKTIAKELPEDTINPIIWGIQRTNENGRKEWDKKQAHQLLIILEEMIAIRHEAQFWTSLPSLVENWYKIFAVGPDFWGTLAKKMATIFTSFDYEREEKEPRIEWMQRAINHPYGELTELYLNYAHKIVADQEKDGNKYEINEEILQFFESTIQHYAEGTRYGVCILGQWLSWLEAVAPAWTKKILIPIFYWTANEERALVAWSGYLFNRTISNSLSESFNDTYLISAKHYEKFADDEQDGLITHVAGLIWFKYMNISDLKKLVSILSNKARIVLLHKWENHLERAQKDIAEEFWKITIIPYWDWCKRRHLKESDANKERFGFWRLLPYSFKIFPEAVKRAVELPPEIIEEVYLFPQRLADSDLPTNYPEEFTELLIAYIKADLNPEWHQEEWQKLWDGVKNSGVHNLSKLKEDLLKKRLIAEEN